MTGKSPTLEGTALLQLRHRSGWTQRRLERTEGLSRGTVSLYEVGTRAIGRPLLNRLAITLGHSIEEVDRILAALVQIHSSDAPEALTPASLRPGERRTVEAAAGRAARCAADLVRAEAGRRLIEDRLRREREAAGRMWTTLQSLPTHAARQNRVIQDSRFHQWAVCERLCEESTRAAAHDADSARELAELALRVAELSAGPSAWRCKLQGYAWAFVGNAVRVGGDLLSANKAFRRSGEFWEAGSSVPDAPLDGGRILQLEASLRRYQGRFEEAHALLSTALREARPPAKRARILLNLAALLELQGAYGKALAILGEAESLTAEAGEPRLVFILEFSRTANLCHVGEFDVASKVLGLVQRLSRELRNQLDALRVSWLAARVAAGLGRSEEAVERLAKISQEFAQRNIGYDAALAETEWVRARTQRHLR